MLRVVLLSMLSILLLLIFLSFYNDEFENRQKFLKTGSLSTGKENPVWIIPDTSLIRENEKGVLIRYGRDLIANTSFYLGPKGIVTSLSNGMNCQNCHLDAGTRVWGNNFSAVASLYPKFRERSGMVESIEKKINDCFERSMNGKTLDSLSKEMRAIVAYMEWLGSTVPKNVKPEGSGLKKISYLDTAADTIKGKAVFISKCMVCHGREGEGKLNADGRTYIYPPLWGKHSYNSGAGIFRISKFAAFVKYNMPLGIKPEKPLLTDEEAWNVAAYVNSRSRPAKDISQDWPDITTKPADHPFGPYADSFSEQQHKYGPFAEIETRHQKR